jgi:hypothetical protein
MEGFSSLLRYLSQAPKECLYALINESDKRIQVYSTSNFIGHISRIAQEIGTLENRILKHDLEKIKLCILETEFDTKLHRDNKYRALVTKYKAEGWEFYSDTNIAQYKIKEGYKTKDKQLYYVLELEDRNKRRLVVGVFDKASEARLWKYRNYPREGIITEIVIADNEWTRNW